MTQQTGQRLTARDSLVTAAIEHLSTYGPAGVQPQEICRELGMSKALVNYHFGTREGLIAEAMVVGYEQYADELLQAVDAAGDDPLDRLFAWIDRYVEWTDRHPGLAAALHFPDVAIGRAVLAADLEDRMSMTGNQVFAHLQLLVLDARTHLKSNDPGWSADGAEVGLTAAIVGWTTLGLSVWMGGNHLSARQRVVRDVLPLAREHMRALVVEMLSR